MIVAHRWYHRLDSQRNVRRLGRTPGRLRVVSYNVWLLPFMSPWYLGRVWDVAERLRGLCGGRGAEDCLTICVVQEAWAWRAGLLWPMHLVQALAQRYLLRRGLVRRGVEPRWYRLVDGVFVVNVFLCQFVPGLRRVLWSPKPVLARALRAAGLPYVVNDAEVSFGRSLEYPFATNVDAGLLTCASHRPDETGFVAFPKRRNFEMLANKGMLWVRFHDVVVVNTHMTFMNEDGGEHRRQQRDRLTKLVHDALEGRLTKCDSVRVRQVVLVGDFNMALPHQTRTSADGADAWKLVFGVPTTRYSGVPWLPSHASVRHLLDQLTCENTYCVRRLSPDDPTCMDGTVDHCIVVCRASDAGASLVASEARVVADATCDVSDHLAIVVDAVVAGERGATKDFLAT